MSLMRYNFNSHAHVERDGLRYFLRIAYPISTHTLTWSVTCVFYRESTIDSDFNSHAHVERDKLAKQVADDLKISTHTLTWSVTVWRNVVSLLCPFQLTRSRGA